jgi:hypothetical protein
MAIHYPVTQNSEDWLKLRTGIPTASSFDKVMTPKKGDLSKQSGQYLYALVAESLVGHVIGFESKWMERGHEYEAEAVKAYQFQTDLLTEEAGFYLDDTASYGASPDRKVVGADAGLEIKCPAPHTHVETMLKKNLAEQHWCQVQGQLLVTGWQWIDIVSYCPELPLVIQRVARDEAFIDKLRTGLTEFCANLKQVKEQLQAELALP